MNRHEANHNVSNAAPVVRVEEADFARGVVAHFEAQAAATPDREALVGATARLTYDALNRAANRLAAAILAERGEAVEPVALVLDHDAPMAVAILAALKAGKVYVALDPSIPSERLRALIDDAQAGVVIAASGMTVPEGIARIAVDALPDGLSDTNPGIVRAPDDPASICTTSGTTGQPKGIVRSHRVLMHSVAVKVNVRHFNRDDRVGLLLPCGFGASMGELLGPLIRGGAVCLYDLRARGADGLADWMVRERITTAHMVPTVFRTFVRALSGDEDLSRFRLLGLGGETVQPADISAYRAHLPDTCLLRLGMSTTEAGGAGVEMIVDKRFEPGDIVPSGYPAEFADLLLLDAQGNPVPPGEAGEIVFRSRYLSPGYWRRPDLTAQAFETDPDDPTIRRYRTGDLGRLTDDGCLLHLGRADAQIKVRGQRVELGEVEAALLDIDGVANAAAAVRGDSEDEPRLVAYIVADRGPLTVTYVRARLAEALPPAMVPTAYVFMDALPCLSTGKVDRAALPEPGTGRQPLDVPYVAPRTPVERAVALLWGETLHVDDIGADDNFLDLGGHSLKAMRVLASISSVFGVTLTPRDFFESPTVAGLAAALLARETEPNRTDTIAIALERVAGMSDDDVRRALGS